LGPLEPEAAANAAEREELDGGGMDDAGNSGGGSDSCLVLLFAPALSRIEFPSPGVLALWLDWIAIELACDGYRNERSVRFDS